MEYEQLVPAWDTATEQAKLDLMVTFQGSTHYVDVAVVSPTSQDAARCAAAAKVDGHACRRETQEKHKRYPATAGPSLYAFVLETHGRPSAEAAAYLRRWATDSTDANAAWNELSVILQRGNARMVCGAAGLRR